jgi:hypothetical protein
MAEPVSDKPRIDWQRWYIVTYICAHGLAVAALLLLLGVFV